MICLPYYYHAVAAPEQLLPKLQVLSATPLLSAELRCHRLLICSIQPLPNQPTFNLATQTIEHCIGNVLHI